MNRITFPLNLRSKGPDVANLQAALLMLIERGVLLRDDPQAQKELSAGLRSEGSQRTYGPATAKAVKLFQGPRQLKETGAVDEATASALNALLRDWKVLSEVLPSDGGKVEAESGVNVPITAAPAPAPLRTIEGQVVLEHGLPGEQLKLRLYRRDFGGQSTLLNETTTLAGGAL
jgi:hypothetical protein